MQSVHFDSLLQVGVLEKDLEAEEEARYIGANPLSESDTTYRLYVAQENTL